MIIEDLLEKAELELENPHGAPNPITQFKLIIQSKQGYIYEIDDVIIDKENDYIIFEMGKGRL